MNRIAISLVNGGGIAVRKVFLIAVTLASMSALAGPAGVDTISVRLKPGDVLQKSWSGGDNAGKKNLLFYGQPADPKCLFVPKSGKVAPKEHWIEIKNTATEVSFSRDKSHIEFGKSYSWVFSGKFNCNGKGSGEPPAWTVNTDLKGASVLTRIELSPKHEDVAHNTTKTYSVKGFDQFGVDITAKCSFDWRKRQQYFGAGGIFETGLGSGTSKSITWLLSVLNGTEQKPTPDRFAGIGGIESAAVVVTGWGPGVSQQKPLRDAHGFSINKGSIVSESAHDGPVTRVELPSVANTLMKTTIVDKTTVPASSTVLLSGSIAGTGSVTVTKSAKASVNLIPSVGIDIEVGKSGTQSLTHTFVLTDSVVVQSSTMHDVKVQFFGGMQKRKVTWDAFKTTTYSSGYVDVIKDGEGSGTEVSPLTRIHITTVP
jgi:hypothetical protein